MTPATRTSAPATDGVVIESGALSDGSTVYLARDAYLDGCMVQASSEPEARRLLDAARVEYMTALGMQKLEPAGAMTIVSAAWSAVSNARNFFFSVPYGAPNTCP